MSEYGSGENAVAGLPQDKPEVVLVDINLAGQSGIHCVCRLKPLMPRTQFVMLTVYEDAEHIYDALAAGATGYLLKRTPREELLASIQQVHEGGSPMTSYIARKVVQSFQRRRSEAPAPDGLSPREWEVLGLLARGYSYKEIADSLGISMPTVNTHIHRMTKSSTCSPAVRPSPATRSFPASRPPPPAPRCEGRGCWPSIAAHRQYMQSKRQGATSRKTVFNAPIVIIHDMTAPTAPISCITE